MLLFDYYIHKKFNTLFVSDGKWYFEDLGKQQNKF